MRCNFSVCMFCVGRVGRDVILPKRLFKDYETKIYITLLKL